MKTRTIIFSLTGLALLIIILAVLGSKSKTAQTAQAQAGPAPGTTPTAGPSPMAVMLMEQLSADIAALEKQKKVWSSVGGSTYNQIMADLESKQSQLNQLQSKYI